MYLLLKPRLNPCAKLPNLHLAVEPLWPSSLLEQDDLFSLILFSIKLKVRLSVAAARFKCGKSTHTWTIRSASFHLKSKRWSGLENLPAIYQCLSFRIPFPIVKVLVVLVVDAYNKNLCLTQAGLFSLPFHTISSQSLLFSHMMLSMRTNIDRYFLLVQKYNNN